MAIEQSPNLGLPYIMAAQAQKHVTHNEAIRALDVLVQLSVVDRDLSGPPSLPADGARYIVGASPSGAWLGRANQIAAMQDGAWVFYVPVAGWRTWVADEGKLLTFDGVSWEEEASASVNPAPLVGVNAIADVSNRLAISSPASLFSHDGAGHLIKINKAAPGDTASVMFQDGFSGRAEFGLIGDDDWHVKVSPDGSTWREAIVVDRATGAVSLPATEILPNDAVTNAKLANVATATLKGRTTAGTGDPEDLTAAQAKTLLALDNVPNVDATARANHTGTQAASTISDFSEAVDDRVAALLVAGTNVTLTYDDGAGTLTVDAAGGGGGSSTFVGLTDTPSAYTGDAGRLLRVNSAETAVEFTDQLPRFGVNATPDATNKLAINSPASLFNHDGAGHQIKINKAAAGDTASVLYQTGFSGRAEFGTTGDDDFHVKVSPDGSAWFEAVVVDKDTGAVSFPNTPFVTGAPLALWDFWHEVRVGNVTATAPDVFLGAAISSGTNSTAIPAAAVLGFNSHGVFLRSSTTANGGYRYQTSSLVSDYFGVINHKFRAKFLWRTAFTDRLVRLGYHDTSTSTDAVDGAYFEIAGAVCSAKTASNSTRTTNATTVTLSLDVAYTFDIEVNAAGTSARFRVYAGTNETPILDVTNTTNIPTSSARAFGAGIVATEASTTASDIGILYELGMGTIAGFEAAKVPKPGPTGATGATGATGPAGPAGRGSAARWLGGEEGIAFDFLAREWQIGDYTDTLSGAGRPQALLTVSRASDASFIGRNGLMQTAASNVLRYDHAPKTGAPRGVLIERAQDNLVIRSDELDDAGWTKTRCTVTANVAAGPFGTTTLDKIVEDSTTNTTHAINRPVSGGVVSGQQYHIACFGRAGEWPGVNLRFSGGFPAGNATFNFATGVVTPAGTRDAAYMIDFGGGLWLAVFVQTATSTTSSSAQVFIADVGITLSGENGTKGVVVGGVMVGPAYPGAYIPTVGSTVTRAADNVSLALSALPFNASRLTMLAEFETAYALGSGQLGAIAALRLDADNRTELQIDPGDVIEALVRASGTDSMAITATLASGTVHRVGMRCAANDGALVANAAPASLDATVTPPTGLTTLFLGSSAGTPGGSLWLRKLVLVNRPLTDAEIAARITAMGT